MSSSGMRIELLNKDNFDTWKIQMEALLVKNDAWGYVDGEIQKPTVERNNEAVVKTWECNDKKAKSDIILSINPSELKQIKGCNTSKEVWDKLHSIYQSKGPAKKATLLKQLTLQRMDNDGDVRDHLNTFFDTIDKLNDMEIENNQDLLTIMLLYSLPPTFEIFRCAIESRDELPSPENLRIKILEQYDAQKNETRNTSNAMIARNKVQNRIKNWNKNVSTQDSRATEFKYKCHICHKKGHKAKDCFKLVKKNERTNNAENVSLYASPKNSAEEMAFIGDSMFSQHSWCLDSGCTTHLCKDIEDFVKIEDTRPGKLSLASSASTDITARGTVSFVSEFNGNLVNVSIKNASHVPDLRTNLLSVGKMTDEGFKIIFDKKSAEIINEKGQTVLQADRISELYFLREKVDQCKSISQEKGTLTEIWHRKMGHLNIRDLQESSRKGTIIGMKLDKVEENFTCEICIQGKMTRSPFPTRVKKSSELLEIIHSDVWGPARTQSNGGARYFVTFIDDCSGWCVVSLIKGKKVFKAFKEFKIFAENQTGKKIKYLQSDNGKEYINNSFNQYLKANGIGQRLTVTHTPEQNGIAERRNRTLVEMARCMLIQSKLPKSFWGEAINTANYTRNRCPSRSIDGKTAFEIWTGKIPNVSYFQEFGCEVFTLNRDPTKGKFESRSKRGIFVGYSEKSKAYRVWITEERKIDITRDVKFTKRSENKRLEQKFIDFPNENSQNIHAENHEEDWYDVLENGVINVNVNEVNEENADEVCEENGAEVSEENVNRVNEDQRHEFDDHEEEIPAVPSELRRARGRPRKIMTGLRGRPRKEYKMIGDVNNVDQVEEFSGLAEIPIHDAVNGPESDEWIQAMAVELKSIIKNDTWIFVDRPQDQPIIGSRVVLRNKYKADGTLERRKARIVARGFSQRPGIDFDETFAPVARISSIRMVISLAAQYGMKIRQFDVTTAYLNGVLDEKIFMEVLVPDYTEHTLEKIVLNEPKNSEIKKKAMKLLEEFQEGDKVCLMKKALYGLRQAGRQWYFKLREELIKFKLTQSEYDECIFYSGRGEDIFMVAIYVDDILAISRNEKKIEQFETFLTGPFEIKSLGEVNYCLGIEFSCTEDEIMMSQKGYVKDILKRFGMSDAKSVTTPIELGIKLKKNEDDIEIENAKNLPYRELVGALMYLAVCTRPDISHAVSYLSQFNSCYDLTHWSAAKRVLRYLKGTENTGLRFMKSVEPLKGYVDADWGNCLDDRRSYTGFVFILGGSPISWESRKQRTVALSSTEAEYMALTEAAKEAIYLHRFLVELGFGELGRVKLLSDSHGAQKLAKNAVFHSRTKHIDIRYHFVRDILKREECFTIEYVSTNDMAADVLTKGLLRCKHHRCLNLMGVQDINS